MFNSLSPSSLVRSLAPAVVKSTQAAKAAISTTATSFPWKTALIAPIVGYCVYKVIHTEVKPGNEFIPEVQDKQIHEQILRPCIQTAKLFALKARIACRSLVKEHTIDYTSRLIDQNTQRPGADHRRAFLNVQNRFQTFPMQSAEAHTHPKSAVSRSAMANHMQMIAHENGWTPYHVSKARTDQFNGSRYYYHPKDLANVYANDRLSDNSVIIMTDVDYYADMPAWLRLGQPILLYTFVPKQCSGRREEYAFYFDGDEVVFDVSGGASYRHKLWNYTGDNICTIDQNGDLLAYTIEQRLIPNDEDHRFICILPTAKVCYPYSLLLDAPQSVLTRYKHLRYLYEPITDQLSIQVSANRQSVELPSRVYEAVKARMLHKTAPPIIADVERILRSAQVPNPEIAAPLLFSHVNLQLEKNVILTTHLVNNFHPIVDDALVTDDGRPSGESATTNLVYPGAAFPTNSEASDMATVEGRVVRPRNTKIPKSEYKTEANNFLSQLIPHTSRGAPWTVAQVHQEQDGVQQRARFETVKHLMSETSSNQLTSFVKAEAYSTANDPRNITTMSPELTTLMSRFTYAFKNEILKKFKFYSPGMKPQEIVDRLLELTTSDGVVTTDYSRFDGSISEWLQKNIVRAAYNRWLTPEYRGEFNTWFDKVFTNHARTANGVHYVPGWGTRSGSPITTDGNTVINAFVIFLAYRSIGYTVKEAFKALGLYCGDDGYTRNATGLATAIHTAASNLGLKVDIEVRNEGPYPYCGRLFVDPSLLPDSFQDLKRTLPKLHLVKNGTMTIEQRITNKAIGYAVTDSKTPILGDWAKTILNITQLTPKNLTHEETYKLEHPWPQTDQEALLTCVMQHLEMTAAEVQSIQTAIVETDTLTSFPVIQEWTPDAKITCVRNGVVEEPSRAHQHDNERRQNPRTHRSTANAASRNQRQQRERATPLLSTMESTNRRRSAESSNRTEEPPSAVRLQVASRRAYTPNTRSRPDNRSDQPAN
uniref:RNA-directed RNA polymerase n=1 Tax=PNG bee virus 14 TaxID=2746873 RepID=A0A7D5BRM8_9VIRU|nr:non-structural polyprotein [PNG bee virus 14]